MGDVICSLLIASSSGTLHAQAVNLNKQPGTTSTIFTETKQRARFDEIGFSALIKMRCCKERSLIIHRFSNLGCWAGTPTPFFTLTIKVNTNRDDRGSLTYASHRRLMKNRETEVLIVDPHQIAAHPYRIATSHLLYLTVLCKLSCAVNSWSGA